MKKRFMLCVGGAPQMSLLWYFFLFCWSRNLRCVKNGALPEADTGSLPAAKMEPFVAIVRNESRIL